MSRRPGRPRRLAAVIVLTALASAAGAATSTAAEPLTVRINDAAARPGGVLAVVVRTYSPRGIGQGQICLRARTNATSQPLAALDQAVVWSAGGDAVSSAEFDALTQTTAVTFSSPSGSINATDGPLAAFFLRLRPDLAPGTVLDLEIDNLQTFLEDAFGVPVVLDPRGGSARVLAVDAPFHLGVEGDSRPPGATSVSGVDSEESLPLAGGHLVFLYDPQWIDGAPAVTVDRRYGEVWTATTTPLPGRLEIDFTTLGGDFGRLPGQLVQVALRLAGDAPVGAQIPLALGAGTSVRDALGAPVVLTVTGGVIEVTAPPAAIFTDGFETGDTIRWATVP